LDIKSSTLTDEKMKTALGDDLSTVEKTIETTLKWIDENSDVSAEEYESKKKEVESLLSPLITKAYQANGGSGNTDDSSKMPGFDPSSFDPSKMPNFDPSMFDPSKMPNFDPSKMPNFDQSKVPSDEPTVE
jgi:hypothetical protein